MCLTRGCDEMGNVCRRHLSRAHMTVPIHSELYFSGYALSESNNTLDLDRSCFDVVGLAERVTFLD
jgi:hypothetical protein